jgi:hypothetical protein
MKQNGPGHSWLLHRPFTHSPKHGYCSFLKFCDVEEVPLFHCETLSLSIPPGQEKRVSSRNFGPEITEPNQKGSRHDKCQRSLLVLLCVLRQLTLCAHISMFVCVCVCVDCCQRDRLPRARGAGQG